MAPIQPSGIEAQQMTFKQDTLANVSLVYKNGVYIWKQIFWNGFNILQREKDEKQLQLHISRYTMVGCMMFGYPSHEAKWE